MARTLTPRNLEILRAYLELGVCSASRQLGISQKRIHYIVRKARAELERHVEARQSAMPEDRNRDGTTGNPNAR